MAELRVRKKQHKSLFKRVSAWLHLWLGLVSGLIVCIICITGCTWVFNQEITAILHPERNVGRGVLLPPSQIVKSAEAAVPKLKAGGIRYTQNEAVEVTLGNRREGKQVFVNPYTGKIIGHVAPDGKKSFDFFRWVLQGHRFLWLPPKIGRPVIDYSTLVFTVILLTGLVLWWPKRWSKANTDKSFKIKANGSRKRLNYDLHNVLGFYSLVLLFAIACTGMVFGLTWFSKSLYWATTGGMQLPKRGGNVKSDTLAKVAPLSTLQVIDKAFYQVRQEQPSAQGFYIAIPGKKERSEPVYMYAYPSANKVYDMQSFVFDRFTGARLNSGDNLYGVKYATLSAGQKLRKLNYDIHVGAIFGLTGKVLVFLVTLIGGSLPITGFIVWLNKKKKSKKKSQPKVTAKAQPAPVKTIGRPLEKMPRPMVAAQAAEL